MEKKFCSKCGKQSNVEARFCESCGNRFSTMVIGESRYDGKVITPSEKTVIMQESKPNNAVSVSTVKSNPGNTEGDVMLTRGLKVSSIVLIGLIVLILAAGIIWLIIGVLLDNVNFGGIFDWIGSNIHLIAGIVIGGGAFCKVVYEWLTNP